VKVSEFLKKEEKEYSFKITFNAGENNTKVVFINQRKPIFELPNGALEIEMMRKLYHQGVRFQI